MQHDNHETQSFYNTQNTPIRRLIASPPSQTSTTTFHVPVKGVNHDADNGGDNPSQVGPNYLIAHQNGQRMRSHHSYPGLKQSKPLLENHSMAHDITP
jgi:hypothetical protein